QEQLVKKDDSRRVYLTPEGVRKAAQTARRFSVIKRFLIEVLSVDEATAQRDACAMEHAVSTNTYLSMVRLGQTEA
ncbi:MAG: metal-dependent transcriptional regulator, partial [Acetanaerobacterium sp.]